MHSSRNLQSVSQRLRAGGGVYFYNATRLRNIIFSFALGRCKVFRGPVSGTSGTHRVVPFSTSSTTRSFFSRRNKNKKSFSETSGRRFLLLQRSHSNRSVGYCSACILRRKISFEQHWSLASRDIELSHS